MALAVVRDESHRQPEVAQRQEQLGHALGARVLVRERHSVRHDEDLAGRGPPASDALEGRVALVLGQKLGLPLFAEGLATDLLVALHPGRLVGPAARALVVTDLRLRLVYDPVAELAGGESQVGVLVVRRRVTPVQPPEDVEDLLADKQAGARAVVHVANEVERGILGVAVAAVVETCAVSPDDPPGFLQATVGVEELGTNDTDVFFDLDGAHEGVEPSRKDNGVVVQKDHVAAPGHFQPGVHRRYEAGVLLETDDGYALDLRQILNGLVTGGVVDCDELVLDPRRLQSERTQAGDRELPVVVDGHDDAHFRLGDGGNRRDPNLGRRGVRTRHDQARRAGDEALIALPAQRSRRCETFHRAPVLLQERVDGRALELVQLRRGWRGPPHVRQQRLLATLEMGGSPTQVLQGAQRLVVVERQLPVEGRLFFYEPGCLRPGLFELELGVAHDLFEPGQFRPRPLLFEVVGTEQL